MSKIEKERERHAERSRRSGGIKGSFCHAITKQGWQCQNYWEGVGYYGHRRRSLCKKHREIREQGGVFETLESRAGLADTGWSEPSEEAKQHLAAMEARTGQTRATDDATGVTE